MRHLFDDDTSFSDPQTQFVHIGVSREADREPPRPTRQDKRPRPSLDGDRPTHGHRILKAAISAVQLITATRESYNISPDRLFVLELNSITYEVRELIERFQAWIVDERLISVNGAVQIRYLVQFPSTASFALFEQELERYCSQEPEATDLTSRQRNILFDGLVNVRPLSAEDRIGRRLASEGFPSLPAGDFYMDVDLWHPGDTPQANELLVEFRRLCAGYNGSVEESTRTTTLLLSKVHGDVELLNAILNLDFVAAVDLPPLVSQTYADILRQNVFIPQMLPPPTEWNPTVCVIDSGVVPGHPFLSGWVVEAYDFDSGEDTAVDLNGHGTAVSGIVVYGDIGQCIETRNWIPKVKICSAKVLRSEESPISPDLASAVFPDRNRVEAITETAIRYFHREHGCRIFNLSVGDTNQVYRGGRQFAWAEKLDELARELDIVVVVCSGNMSNPGIPENTYTRLQFQEALRNQALHPDKRVSNPATAALAITVGAVSRSDALTLPEIRRSLPPDAFPAVPAGSLAPFSRTGPGYSPDMHNASIKPEVVAFGGNYAVVARNGQLSWAPPTLFLGEPAIIRERGGNGRFVGSVVGTSYASPFVSHTAALAMKALEESLGEPPSANLIRALVASGVTTPAGGSEWLVGEESALKLIGFGQCQADEPLRSTNNRVRLVAMDEVEENKLHIYRIPIPADFIRERGKRGITISLAYDPPVRASRKEYIARTMWFHAVHGLTTDEVVRVCGKMSDTDEPVERTGSFLKMRPTRTKSQWSTLQVRKIDWPYRTYPRIQILEGESEPVLHVVVGCHKRFSTGLEAMQKYGIVILFWHEGEQLELYQSFRSLVNVRTSRIRV